MKKIQFLLLAFILTFLSTPTFAQTAGEAYIIQTGDWLSKVAEIAYGSPHKYERIIKGTNEHARTDASFQYIDRPNQIKLGQKVWIPNDGLVNLPETDCEIRVWYNYQVVAIGKINEKWLADGIDLKTRAKMAYELRHQARVNARFMMQDKTAVDTLRARDIRKYGNPDGPTFDYLVQRNIDKYEVSKEEAYQGIIDSSSRTSTAYNDDCK